MKSLAHLRAVLVSAQAMTPAADAQAPGPGPEYRRKAAYLFDFAKCTEWPPAVLPAAAPIHVCVAGRDPFGDILGTLESRSVQSHPIRVRRGRCADTLRGCHLGFVTEEDDRTEQAVLRSAEAVSALTVSDREGVVTRGGTVGMVARDSRSLIEVNVEAGERAGLELSLQMLKLARSVEGRP